MSLARRSDWVSPFNTWIETCRRHPFDWAGLNCVSFAIGAVEAVTGVRVWQPDWQDEYGALRRLDELGGLEAAVTAVLGEPLDRWQAARRGDIAMVNQGNRPALMVCGGLVLFGVSEKGLETKPLKAAIKIWRVG